ncbi:MAG: phage repressor like transcriptional regulator, XRE family [Candidatus Frackibacter sp. T328-2]|nr:MAG: phage repressor like transcriptional regulator, XRE family [Candidatus Frackibacter sp. T328-2]
MSNKIIQLNQKSNNNLPEGAIPVSEETTIEIPVINNISCLNFILAPENIISYRLTLKDSLDEGTYFFVKFKENFALADRLASGDYVLIRQQSDVKNGEIAAVIINDINPKIKLRKIYKDNNQITLKANDPNYDPITLPENRVKILGKCIMIEKDF